MIFCKKNYQNFTTDDYSGEYLDFKKFCIYKSQKKEQAFTYQALMFNQTFHLIRMQTSLGFKAVREQFEKLSIHGSFKQRERRERALASQHWIAIAAMCAMLPKTVPTTVYSTIVRIHFKHFQVHGYILVETTIDWVPKITYLCGCRFYKVLTIVFLWLPSTQSTKNRYF